MDFDLSDPNLPIFILAVDDTIAKKAKISALFTSLSKAFPHKILSTSSILVANFNRSELSDIIYSFLDREEITLFTRIYFEQSIGNAQMEKVSAEAIKLEPPKG